MYSLDNFLKPPNIKSTSLFILPSSPNPLFLISYSSLTRITSQLDNILSQEILGERIVPANDYYFFCPQSYTVKEESLWATKPAVQQVIFYICCAANNCQRPDHTALSKPHSCSLTIRCIGF